MKLRILSLLVPSLLWAAGAHASKNPTPPPSGIVVHLFGPNSITSHILPETPEHAAGPSPAGTTAPGNDAAPGTATGGTAAAQPDNGPSLGDVLHQMFVTGDPTVPPEAKFAKGKTAPTGN